MREHKLCSLTSILMVSIFSFFAQETYAQTSITYSAIGANQYYVVPPGVTSLAIECWGARGGKSAAPQNNFGGKGAHAYGEFNVSPGDTLVVIVGHIGENGGAAGTNIGGGGGGGSFVIQKTGYVPMIIAAGGGGGSFQGNAEGEPGQASVNAGGGAYSSALSGEGGFTDNSGGGGNGGGGSGWNSDGVGNNWTTSAVMQGGAGGTSFWAPDPFGDGGFGGGGAAYNGGGGGGGYTGGGGGGWSIGGGGGGSYNTGSNQVNTSDVNNGNGAVTITTNCTQMTANASVNEVCLGDQLTLTANSNFGGVITWDNGASNGVPFTTTNVGLITYIATSSDAGDCGQTVTVLVKDLPNVVATADTTQFCFGTNQQVTLTGSGANTYIWDNGVFNGASFEPPAGTTVYTVTGIDTNGCQNVDSISILSSVLITSFVIVDELFGNDGSIDLTVTGGLAPYEYDWNMDGAGDWDDLEDQFGLTGGIYYVNVRDLLGCTVFSSATVNGITDFENLEEVNINLFPNPTKDVLHVELVGEFNCVLLDLKGNLIMSTHAFDKISFDIRALEPGQYLLLVEQNGHRSTSRFIKE